MNGIYRLVEREIISEIPKYYVEKQNPRSKSEWSDIFIGGFDRPLDALQAITKFYDPTPLSVDGMNLPKMR